MHLTLVGLSHKTAPVEIREKLTFPAAAQPSALSALTSSPAVNEAVIVSTCNRTEVYAVTASGVDGPGAIIDFMADYHDLDRHELVRYLYIVEGEAVVRHLFRVVASLDSMVLGEAQILGQVKDAYRAAVAARSCGPVLSRLFQHAFRAAKRMRSETGLGAAQVSVARVGVALAREIFEDFADKQVLLLGAGEMAESALRGLREAGARRISVVNRTLASAVELAARHGGTAHALEALPAELAAADIAIASVQVEQPLLGRAELALALGHRRGRPLFVVDLGIPRNVAPAAGELEDVYLYDLDDLEATAERGRQQRASAAEAAREIAREEAERYLGWLAVLPHVPTVVELRERLLALAKRELARAPGGDAAERDRVAEALVAKLLHRPLERLRREAAQGTSSYYAEALRELFGLDEEEEL